MELNQLKPNPNQKRKIYKSQKKKKYISLNFFPQQKKRENDNSNEILATTTPHQKDKFYNDFFCTRKIRFCRCYIFLIICKFECSINDNIFTL